MIHEWAQIELNVDIYGGREYAPPQDISYWWTEKGFYLRYAGSHSQGNCSPRNIWSMWMIYNVPTEILTLFKLSYAHVIIHKSNVEVKDENSCNVQGCGAGS